MHIDLSGKTFLLTGAGRGIGLAIARQLLASGATLALHYGRSHTELLALQEAYPQKAFLFASDLSQANAASELFHRVISVLKSLDGLVNNAGIALKSPLEGGESAWLEVWQQTMQVNLVAAAQLSRRAVLHFMAEKKPGRMVHIASRAAFRGDTAEFIAYAASKGGMVAMSHSLARAYGKQGICSFVVAPGFTQTDMAQDFMAEYGEQHALHDIVLPQLTQATDIAPMVAVLLSGLADHATGSTISINAGSYIH
ncbi:MAG: SDR family oxidoreductase [Microscillaceae bacterium]